MSEKIVTVTATWQFRVDEPTGVMVPKVHAEQKMKARLRKGKMTAAYRRDIERSDDLRWLLKWLLPTVKVEVD